jgi:16S rRNA (guanine966-N2)-methyltransferase
VLDLFAGTGALGIEALSRGAECLVSVDRSGRVVAALQKSLDRFEIGDEARVMRMDARGAIRRLADKGDHFDLVFVDAPYEAVDEAEQVLIELEQSGLLGPDAVVVVECAKRHAVPPIPGLLMHDERIYGDTLVRWLVPGDLTQATGGAAKR